MCAPFPGGRRLRGICNDLNERGVPTSTGGRWSPQTLRRMLGAPRISGQREHKGEIVAAAEWPAIISRSDGERIRARLADPDRRTNKSARRYLLVRLLKCEQCGEYMVSAPRADGIRRYGCRKGAGFAGCGKTFINAEPLEQFVVDAMLARLDAVSSPPPSARARPAGRRALAAGDRHRPGPTRRTLARLRQQRDHDGRVAHRPRADRAATERRAQAARPRSPTPPSSTASSATPTRSTRPGTPSTSAANGRSSPPYSTI